VRVLARVWAWLGLLGLLGCLLVWVPTGALSTPMIGLSAGFIGAGLSLTSMLAATSDAPDRLASTVEMWLADERPAWETIEAFERDVERVLRGQVSRPPGMPLRPPPTYRDVRAATDAMRRDAEGWSSVRRTSQGTVYKT
jgi:hypothetical protein